MEITANAAAVSSSTSVLNTGVGRAKADTTESRSTFIFKLDLV